MIKTAVIAMYVFITNSEKAVGTWWQGHCVLY